MSVFTRPQRPAHPEWLDEFFKAFESQTAPIKNKRLPEAPWFPFITTLACRMLRIAFRSRWSAAWHIFKWALAGTRGYFYGILVRFWRYRVCMHSAREYVDS